MPQRENFELAFLTLSEIELKIKVNFFRKHSVASLLQNRLSKHAEHFLPMSQHARNNFY